MTIFKKHSLRAGNNRTRAAELTLRESIFPLCLVTILFFLWVSFVTVLFFLARLPQSAIRCYTQN